MSTGSVSALNPVELGNFAGRLSGWDGSRGGFGDRSSTPRASREWWIYFIQGSDGGPIKIGRSLNIRNRLCELQVGYPFGELRCVGASRGLIRDEKRLHAKFSHLRIRGEWFHPSEELLAFVRSVSEGGSL